MTLPAAVATVTASKGDRHEDSPATSSKGKSKGKKRVSSFSHDPIDSHIKGGEMGCSKCNGKGWGNWHGSLHPSGRQSYRGSGCYDDHDRSGYGTWSKGRGKGKTHGW